MDKEKLVSHFENLVPGIATLFLGATLVSEKAANPFENSALLEFLKQPFIVASVFIALSYLTAFSSLSLADSSLIPCQHFCLGGFCYLCLSGMNLRICENRGK